jgi:hypothetical protein
VQGGAAEYAALIVYAVCFFLMFGFSFAYNMVPDSAVKRWLRRCDHSGIYLMIAGTYTALMALVQAQWWTVALVAFVWCGAVVGVASKLFMPTRFDRGAVGFYLALELVGGRRDQTALRHAAGDRSGADRRRRVDLFGRSAVLHLAQPEVPERDLACLRRAGRRPPVRRGRGGDRRAILTPQSRGVLIAA